MQLGFKFLILMGILLGNVSIAAAQDAEEDVVVDPENPGIVYKKKTEFDFEDDVVEGSFVRPEGDYIDSRRGGRYSSLIRIRENFVPEMLKSAEDI